MKINGLIAAPVTPFKENGNIAPETIPQYANFLKKQGVAGVFVNGTTGEGFSLTDQERKVMAEAWCTEKTENFKVFIHVGHTSQKTSRALSEHAESFGADAIGEMGPIFFKPANINDLVNYCQSTASSSSLPYYYYHMPSMNGIDFKMLDFLKLADDKIPNLAGIKYTHMDIDDFSKSLQFKEHKYDLLFGRDEALLKAMPTGLQGAVGSTYNCHASDYYDLIKCYKNGNMDEAEKLQNLSIDRINLFAEISFFSALRHSMRIQGLETGEPRAPIMALSSTQKSLLEEKLNKLSTSSIKAI